MWHAIATENVFRGLIRSVPSDGKSAIQFLRVIALVVTYLSFLSRATPHSPASQNNYCAVTSTSRHFSRAICAQTRYFPTILLHVASLGIPMLLLVYTHSLFTSPENSATSSCQETDLITSCGQSRRRSRGIKEPDRASHRICRTLGVYCITRT